MSDKQSTRLFQLLVRGYWRARGSLFLRNVGVLTVGSVSVAVFNFVQGILVARLLGPSDYGMSALVISYPALLFSFFDAKPIEAATKYLTVFWAAKDRLRMSAMIQLTLLVDFGVALVALIGVLASGRWAARTIVHSSQYMNIMYLYSASFLLNSAKDTASAVLAVQDKFKTVAVLNIATSLFRTLLILCLVLLGYGVPGVVLASAISLAFDGIVFGIVAFHFVHREWELKWTWNFWKPLKGYRQEVMRFIAFNDLMTLVAMIPKQADVLLLGHFRGATDVGFYRLAKAFAGVIGYIVDPLQSVAFPRIVKVRTEETATAFWRLISRMAWQVGMPLGVLAAIGGILFIPYVLPQIAGHQYSPAVFPTLLLYLTSCFWLTFFWIRPAFLALGRMKELTFIFTVMALVVTPAYCLTVSRWGAAGIASSYLIIGGPMVYGAFLLSLRVWRRTEVHSLSPA